MITFSGVQSITKRQKCVIYVRETLGQAILYAVIQVIFPFSSDKYFGKLYIQTNYISIWRQVESPSQSSSVRDCI